MTIVKQDINFFEYPIWFQNSRAAEKSEGSVWKDIDGYTYRAGYKTPSKTDYVFLMCLLHECQKNGWDTELESTRGYILKTCGIQKGMRWYKRLEDSLIRWKHVGVQFNGIFYDGENYQTINFGIIETWSIHEETKKLFVRFNKEWILKIKNSEYYKMIDFDIIKRLRSPLVIRLYEILLKSFQGRNSWKIDAVKLAKKIPLNKKYASDIVSQIKPAVNRIRENTPLNIYLELDKQARGKIILFFILIENEKVPQLPTDDSNDELSNLIPTQHTKTAQSLIQKFSKLKGVEYVKKNILYVNSQNPDTNYCGYLANALKKNFGSNYDPNTQEYKKYRTGGQQCYNKNKSCGAEWKKYKDNPLHNCHWCPKFKTQREKLNGH